MGEWVTGQQWARQDTFRSRVNPEKSHVDKEPGGHDRAQPLTQKEVASQGGRPLSSVEGEQSRVNSVLSEEVLREATEKGEVCLHWRTNKLSVLPPTHAEHTSRCDMRTFLCLTQPLSIRNSVVHWAPCWRSPAHRLLWGFQAL
jgi:hypothetical protein